MLPPRGRRDGRPEEDLVILPKHFAASHKTNITRMLLLLMSFSGPYSGWFMTPKRMKRLGVACSPCFEGDKQFEMSPIEDFLPQYQVSALSRAFCTLFGGVNLLARICDQSLT